MTTKQAYTCLARIAAMRCYDGKKFVSSRRVGKESLEVVQQRILALLQKLNYPRFCAEFHRETVRPVEPAQIYSVGQTSGVEYSSVIIHGSNEI